MVYVRYLVWDAWNVDHIARHGITAVEVDEVFAGLTVTSETYADRLRVIGSTGAGQLLTVILAPQGLDIYYTVTARPASRKERRIYRSTLMEDET
jgi:uncharacterized DUF497 family protein